MKSCSSPEDGVFNSMYESEKGSLRETNLKKVFKVGRIPVGREERGNIPRKSKQVSRGREARKGLDMLTPKCVATHVYTDFLPFFPLYLFPSTYYYLTYHTYIVCFLSCYNAKSIRIGTFVSTVSSSAPTKVSDKWLELSIY